MKEEKKYSHEDTSQFKKGEEHPKKKQDEELILIKDIAFQSLAFPVGIADMNGKIIFVNLACRKLLGLTEDKEILGKHISEFSLCKDQVNKAALAVQQGNSYIGEDSFIKNDATRIDYQVSSEIIKFPDGKPIGILSCFIDITEKKRSEEISKETKDKFIKLINQSNDVVWRCSIDGKHLIDLNDSFKAIFGSSCQEFIENPNLWIEMVHPHDRKIAEESGNELLRNGNALAEYRIVRPDGEIRWLLDRKSVIYDNKGNPIEIGGFATDITKRKQLEETIQLANLNLEQEVRKQTAELKKSEEQLRALASHLQIVREEERISIARDIHDDLGSFFTMIKTEIEELIDHDKNLKKSVRDKLISLIDYVETAIDSLRTLATKLRPAVLDHFGLIPAMEWQIQQFKIRNKINLNHEFVLKDYLFSKNESTAIFRIFQEILTNILRHSEATKVNISFKGENENVILKVEDNGIGFETDKTGITDSFGLLGMKERAHSIGGKLIIDSIPMTGTTITLVLMRK